MMKDRATAGKQLAKKLSQLNISRTNTVVIALPRGGVPVAYEISYDLNLPLDIIAVKKISHPSNPELALGAVTSDNDVYYNHRIINSYGITDDELDNYKNQALHAAQEQVQNLRKSRSALLVQDINIILVDDGIATGATVQSAIKLLKDKGARKIWLAVPVCPRDLRPTFESLVDEMVTLEEPENLWAVGQFYQNFPQVNNQAVIDLLALRPHYFDSVSPFDMKKEFTIVEGGLRLPGVIYNNPSPKGWVIFAHGSGSSRKSPRNNFVAERLQNAGMSVLLFDLLKEQEDVDYNKRFDIPFLAERLKLATQWLVKSADYQIHTPIAFYGASTGSAAALLACTKINPQIQITTVVSRGGRPDLVPSSILAKVIQPVLLLVGGLDHEVIIFNQKAKESLQNCQLTLIQGASHLFEEAGCMEHVAKIASDWFVSHFEQSQEFVVHQ